ncbi:hypothetical protein [Novosphingobium sp.]|uniref:hypothetical protein n=1 Tax=Novosphingobium sp. TaxID=1874826 RepID=UPI001EBF9314|nr:hypothetical protein [Novosphingobium sp.]MBK9010020.1 hypothetical protein [Novosphingobium sp.]
MDLAISGGFVTLANASTVRSVTGSAESDYLELGFLKSPHTPVTASINLGGGDDFLYLSLCDATQIVPGLPAVVEGGAGHDQIYLSIPTGVTVDGEVFGVRSGQYRNLRLYHIDRASDQSRRFH